MKDRRHWGEKFPIADYEFDQGTWAAAVSAAVEKEIDSEICGTIFAMDVKINETPNNITMTVVLKSANGAELCSVASIADNGTTMIHAESGKSDADFNPIPIFGPLTLTMTPSGVPGAGGAECDVTIFMR